MVCCLGMFFLRHNYYIVECYKTLLDVFDDACLFYDYRFLTLGYR